MTQTERMLQRIVEGSDVDQEGVLCGEIDQMNIEYTVTHCWHEDYADERWNVLAKFDKLEDAILYHGQHCDNIEEGFLFVTVEWSRCEN